MTTQGTDAVRSPRRNAGPDLSEMLFRALTAVQVVMPDGQRQSRNTRKVRAREMDCASVLQDNLDDLMAAGATDEQLQTVALTVLRYINLKRGAIASARDLHAAFVTETRAQASVDVLQMKVANVAQAADADLETLIPRLYFQREATDAAILAAECELHERAEKRAAARRGLFIGRAA